MTFEEKLRPYVNNENRSSFVSYSLDPIRKASQLLGDPWKEYRAVLITGTNGKGTCAAYLSELFSAAGLRCGRYTSPHLQHINERIVVESEISDVDAVEIAETIEALCGSVRLTYFDMLTLIAFEWFKRQKVDIAVLETGLGGTLDSTTIVSPDISIITDISLDHTHILGSTIEKITYDKSGIIRRKTPVIISSEDERVRAILKERAQQLEAPACFFGDDYRVDSQIPGILEYSDGSHSLPSVRLQNFSAFTPKNAATALKAFFTSGATLDTNTLCSTLSQVNIAGRFEKLHSHPDIYYDVAHNEASLKALLQTCEFMFPKSQLTLFFSCMQDKEPEKMIALIKKSGHKPVYITLPLERAYLPTDHTLPVVSVTDKEKIASLIDPEKSAVFCGTFRMYEYMADIVKGIIHTHNVNQRLEQP